MRRTDALVSALARADAALADPGSQRSEQPAGCRNPLRSLKPGLFVAVGICPGHGSRFDLAGRVVRNVPAPTNLDIPPHQYLADGRLRIG